MRNKFTVLFTVYWQHLLLVLSIAILISAVLVCIFGGTKKYELDVTSNKTGKRYIIKVVSNGEFEIKEIQQKTNFVQE